MADQSTLQHKVVVYDVETLINLFSACFLDLQTNKKREFVLFNDVEQLKELVRFLKLLKKHNYELVGFNNLNFDAQILEYILENYQGWLMVGYSAQDVVRFIYEKAQYLINLDEKEKWTALIPEYKMTIPQIDLFKQKHYDGKAKMGTSLKWVQFTMRYPTVEEMPIGHDEFLTSEQIPTVLSYNWNDVESTGQFFRKNVHETELRKTLSEKYKLNLLNASEPRLAKMIFGKFLCDEMGITAKELKEMRTFRKQVRLKDVILPYIKFNTPELNAVLDKIKATTINPNVKDKFDLTFNYGGIETVVGLGGIHACCKSGVYEATENMIIHDVDVTSFYPNLAIENNLRPKHLGPVFNKVYKFIFDERQKIPKKDPTNYVYKIILNSTYGLSKEVNSYLYDPFFTYSITINGQLSILMLVERLVTRVPNLKIFQENTDGVTIGYAPEYKPLVDEICAEWCKLTKLQLEHAFYKKMVIRDVNNYMAAKTDFDWDEYQQHIKEGKKRSDYGKIKHKGAFELELDYHKNPSFVVVPMAAESHFFGTLSFRDFIYQHDNIFDFLGGVKKKMDFKLNINLIEDRSAELLKYKSEEEILNAHGYHEWYGGTWKHKDAADMGVLDKATALKAVRRQYEQSVHTKIPQQKVTRYYISTSGGIMTKDYHGGKKAGQSVAVESGWTVQPLNVVTDQNVANYNDIQYSYYIKEAERLITSIEGNANQLKLF